ncbi:MAG: glycine zipper 2TM domain-containing protein [Alphaproteobacteria bacterium]|nr:glycine zipper 2TM domain-containing protein [Alphaproteobacteria bacterium]
MKKILLSALIISSLALAGCETGGKKQTIGTGAGAILGGLAGSQFGSGKGQLVAVGVGTLLGALAGSEIGQSLDRADMMYAQQAQQRAYNAPVGQSISWNNPESGNYGTYTPTRNGTDAAGRYCREYRQTINVGGRSETAVGTACENPDGTWQVVS